MRQPVPAWTAAVRSLADDLRRRTVEQLAELFVVRPDLIRPAPADLGALAGRACTRAAVHRALEGLDAGRLRVLQALAVTGNPVDADAAAALVGADVERIHGVLDELWRHALAWRSADGYHLVRQAVEALGPYPGGLAPAHRQDAILDLDEAAVRAALEAAPAGRTVVEHLVWGPPVGVVEAGGRVDAAITPLMERGILRRGGTPEEVVLPRPVALMLRGGRLWPDPVVLDEPSLLTRSVRPDDVATGAGATASTLLGQLDELAQAWGEHPPRVLRTRGLAVRDLATVASGLGVPQAQAAFLVELGYAAGLLDDDGELEPVWAPTPQYDEWLALPSSRRWLTLARAWCDTVRAAHLIGRRPAEELEAGSGGKATGRINALSHDAVWFPIRELRAELLADLAAVPPDQMADPDSLIDRLLWRHPLRARDPLAEAARAVLEEAGWLGLAYGGALGPPGRALVGELSPGGRSPKTPQHPQIPRTPEIPKTATGTGPADPLESVVAAHLPAPATRILLQADLTAVAPGRLEGVGAQFLRLAADVESRGGATVHRFSPTSIRRCLDAGWSADQLLGMLAELTGRGPDAIPQPLAYLVTDTARRHGLTRVGSATTYLRSDDVPGLDEMVADRRLSALRLRRLAPGVVISPSAAATVLDLLRTHGYSPVAESPEGAVVFTPRDQHRARQHTARRVWAGLPTRPPVPHADPADAARVASALIEAERKTAMLAAKAPDSARHEADDTGLPDTDPVFTRIILREAAAERRPVRIGVSDAAGQVRGVDIVPERVSGGRVDAQSVADGGALTFSMARITGARPL